MVEVEAYTTRSSRIELDEYFEPCYVSRGLVGCRQFRFAMEVEGDVGI